MPTLFRLLFVLGIIASAGYGALYSVANVVKPQPRLIVENVTLPQNATEVHTGRSVAEVLTHHASTLVRRGKRIGH